MRNQRKILVVDDEAMIRDIMEVAFEDAGYDVTCVESGEEALKIAEETTFSVMFIDIQLGGMSGLELARAIRKKQPFAQIIAMTGYSAFYDEKECMAHGCNAFFPKPLNLAELIRLAQYSFAKVGGAVI